MNNTERIQRPKVARFRQTTHHRKTTRADLVRHAARVRATLEG
jgi:3-methyladenine DNA glycosylase Tag